MIKNKLIFILTSLVILMGCEKKYNDFGDIAIRPEMPITKTIEPEEDSLKLLYGSLDTQANAYWLEHDSMIHILPFIWQSQQRRGHSLKPEDGVIIVTQTFVNAWVDTIDFKEAFLPQILLHTVDATGLQRLEIFELKEETAVLLLNLSTRGEISYEPSITQESLTRIKVEIMQNGLTMQDFYKFDAATQQFVLDESERLQNDGIASSNRYTAREIETFLKGPWVKKDEEREIIVAFMPEEQEILFAHNSKLEIYNWRSSSRSGSRINVEARNRAVDHILGNSSIQVIDTNTISLNMISNTFWEGEYRRMNLREYLTLTLGPVPRVVQNVPFSGSFTTSSGEEFVFENPFFTRTHFDGTQRTGRFSMFTINNQPILQLRYTNSYGYSTQQENFSFTINEQTDSPRFLRSITLVQVNLFINGGFPVGTAALRLEQITAVGS